MSRYRPEPDTRRPRGRILTFALSTLLFAACHAGERDVPEWTTPTPADARNDSADAPDGTSTDADAGEISDCDPIDPPKCDGPGTIGWQSTDAGCRVPRCNCPDWARYDEEKGKCVDETDDGIGRKPCTRDSDCDSGYCDDRYLGSDEQGVCLLTCKSGGADRCPDGWVCFVPGDVAGYCLPRCECGKDSCSRNRSCVGHNQQRCLHESNVDDWQLTCNEPGDWCDRACDSLQTCNSPPITKRECLRRCDATEEAECLYNSVLGRDGVQRSCESATTCLE